MKRINFIGSFRDNSFEGFMKIVERIKTGLSSHYKIEVNSSKPCKLINIHTGGFLEALRTKPDAKTIYSLHATFGSSFFEELKEQGAAKKYLLDTKHSFNKEYGNVFKKFLFRLASISTPVMLRKELLKKFEVVVLPNNYMKRMLKLKNSRVIYHGINMKKFVPQKVQSNKTFKVAYFGHLAISKGVLEVVNAFSALPDIEKTLYISTPTQKFKQFVRRRDSSIKLGGYVKDIARAYNESDLIVLPFRNETAAIGTPLVLIEALACGRPVITTDLPHIREYCSDVVYYVKPGDTFALIKAIAKLKENKELRDNLSSKARAQVLKRHNEQTMIKKYKELYEELL